MHTNASTLGLGAVLYQEQGCQGWVISYASRILSKAESRYVAHKLEFLALKRAVMESFEEYLYGNMFSVYSNNNPLEYILTMAKLDAMGHTWIAKLTPFNFTSITNLASLMWRQTLCSEFHGTRSSSQTECGLLSKFWSKAPRL